MITAAQSALNRQRAHANARSHATARLLLTCRNKELLDFVLLAAGSRIGIPRHRPAADVIGTANHRLAWLEAKANHVEGVVR